MITVEDILTLEKFKPLKKHIIAIVKYCFKKYFKDTILDEAELMQDCIMKLATLQKENKLDEAITPGKSEAGETIYPLLKTIIENHFIDKIRKENKDVIGKMESLDAYKENDLEHNDVVLSKSDPIIKPPRRMDVQDLLDRKHYYHSYFVKKSGIFGNVTRESFEPDVLTYVEFNERCSQAIKVLKPFEYKILLYTTSVIPQTNFIYSKMAKDLNTDINKIKRAMAGIWYTFEKLRIESQYKNDPKEKNYQLNEVEHLKKAFKDFGIGKNRRKYKIDNRIYKMGEPLAYFTGKSKIIS